MRGFWIDATDRDLVDAVLEGHGAAAEAFFERFRRLVASIVNSARSSRLSEADAEEIVQEVWLRIFNGGARALAAWRGDVRLDRYVATIARNRLRDWMRERRPELVDGDAIDGTKADEPSAADRLLAAERLAAVRAVRKTLSDDERRLFDAVYVHGRSAAEIARELGIPANTVHQRLFALRRRVGLGLRWLFPELFDDTS